MLVVEAVEPQQELVVLVVLVVVVQVVQVLLAQQLQGPQILVEAGVECG
jgi:hypothetical protein